MPGMQCDYPGMISQLSILRSVAHCALRVVPRLVPALQRREYPGHGIIGIDLVAALGEIGAGGAQRVAEMLTMFGVVHGEESVVDSLRIEEPLLRDDERVGLAGTSHVTERALRVGFIAERLGQRIELGATSRRGEGAPPLPASAVKFRLQKQRLRVIRKNAQRFI